MKRNFSNLTKTDIWNVKRWLKDPRGDSTCPFIVCPNRCNEIFPTLHKELFLSDPCPCTKFGIRYVVKVAREIVRRSEAINL